jgi:hypothetical protein
VALSTAKERGDDALLSTARRIIEEDVKPMPIAARLAARRALALLPSDLVLPLARQWRSSRLRRFRLAAGDILIRHATSDDLGWIRMQLRRPISDGRVYTTCRLVEMLCRFPHEGPFIVLNRIYGEFPYSYGRRFMVKALSATDPGFGSELAFECLWDCEETIREAACDVVELSLSGTRERLDDLAADRWEEEEVREIARKRFQGQKESALS